MEAELTTGVATRSGARWPQIDGLRAFAATSVFLMHAWLILKMNLAFGFIYQPSVELALQIGADEALTVSPFFRQAGGVGVALFFAISGFLLYQPFVRARDERTKVALKPYFLRRAARIVPAYWLALIVIGLVTGNRHVFTWSGFINYFMFGEIWTTLDISRLTHPHQFNALRFPSDATFKVIDNNPVPVAWTLCVEVFFYLMLPLWAGLAAKLTRTSRRPIRLELFVIGALIAASMAYKAVVISTVAQFEYESWLMIPPATIDTFLVGMALACLTVRSQGKDGPGFLRPLGATLGSVGLLRLQRIQDFVCSKLSGTGALRRRSLA